MLFFFCSFFGLTSHLMLIVNYARAIFYFIRFFVALFQYFFFLGRPLFVALCVLKKITVLSIRFTCTSTKCKHLLAHSDNFFFFFFEFSIFPPFWPHRSIRLSNFISLLLNLYHRKRKRTWRPSRTFLTNGQYDDEMNQEQQQQQKVNGIRRKNKKIK